MPGFDIPKEAFKDGENRYPCHSCKLLLRDPVQPGCGHRLCKSCADEIISRESIPRCPECEEKFSVEDGAHYFPDLFAERKIKALFVICPFSEAGCNWEGKFEEYHTHLRMCDYKSDLHQCFRLFSGNTDFEQGDLVQCHSRESVIQAHKRSEVFREPSQCQLKDLLTKAKDHLLCHLEEAVENKDNDAASLRVQIAMLEKQIHSLNSRQKCSDFTLSQAENTNDDGFLSWKITQFSQQIADTQTGKSTLVPLPIYFERQGYEMCLWFYIMGDGIGNLSLFFVVQRPFAYKVTFKLINQAGGPDIISTFKPDPSNSLGKPKSDMNIASGCPRFVAHTELESNFTVDDVIYIKCIIDTSNLHHT